MIFCKMLYTITKDHFKESGPFVFLSMLLFLIEIEAQEGAMLNQNDFCVLLQLI